MFLLSNFRNNRLWFTKSNAFLKSTSRARMAPPRSRVDCHSWIIAINACVVDLIGLHPYCLLSNDGSKTDWSQCPIKDSRTLAIAGSRDWSEIILDGPWASYLLYGNNLSRLPDWRDKPLPNGCVKNWCQRFAQICGKIAQEPVWEAIWPWLELWRYLW